VSLSHKKFLETDNIICIDITQLRPDTLQSQ